MNPTESGALHVPPELLAKVQEAAREDNRSPDDLVDEALQRYLDERSWQHLYAYGEERARRLGITEQDVPRILAEHRERHRHGAK